MVYPITFGVSTKRNTRVKPDYHRMMEERLYNDHAVCFRLVRDTDEIVPLYDGQIYAGPSNQTTGNTLTKLAYR